MTYCVAVKLDSGILTLSDTRTNAGVDNISTVRKTVSWEVPGERSISLMSAGNLATTQAVTAWLDERNKSPDDRNPSILAAPSMFAIANIVGRTLKTEVDTRSQSGSSADAAFSGTLILSGQIAGAEPRLYLVYPEGNFIEATADNPFFQIGETKYGKPIIDRIFNARMPVGEAAKMLLISMDSTVRSNLSVGPPFDLRFLPKDAMAPAFERRLQADDPYFSQLSGGWGDSLRQAFDKLPDMDAG